MFQISGLLIGFLFVLSLIPQSSATVVWSDDFSGSTLTGWNVTDGTWEVDSGYLKNIQDVDWHCRIWHASSQVTGTWSFDVCLLTNDVDILFMANGTDPPQDNTGYGIRLTGEYIVLIKQDGSYDTAAFLSSSSIGDHDSTWTSFDITRNITGGFNIYVNATSDVAEPVISFVDDEFSYSERLVVYCRWGHARFDNIVVSDTIDITPASSTPPVTTSTPPDTTTTDGGTIPPPIDTNLIILGAGAAGVIIVAVVVFIRRR